MENTTKICTCCNCEKELNQFQFRNDTQKYRNSCIECEKKRYSNYYDKNKNKILQDKKEYRLNNIDKFKEKDKEYYVNNLNIIKAKRKHYVNMNKDKIREYKQKEDYKIKERLFKHKRRLKIKQGNINTNELKALINKNKTCYWCDIELNGVYHIDHYYPLSKGGSHTIDNIVISCPSCNLKKHSKDPLLFAIEKGRLF